MKYIYNILIILLITVVYSNSINFGFTLDDDFFIENNHYVKKGVEGIYEILTKAPYGEYDEGSNELQTYRPMSHILFAFIYEFANNNPKPYHVVSIVLFSIFGLILFKFLSTLLFPNINIINSFFITIIFISHPLNVESVANIKGIDDVLAGIFILLMLFVAMKYIFSKNVLYLLLSALFFLLATLSKESALFSPVLLIIIPFYLNIKIERKSLIKSVVIFSVVGISWFVFKLSLNSLLITETNYFYLNNNLSLYSPLKRIIIAFFIQFKYIQLFIFPNELRYDYSFGYFESIKQLLFIGTVSLITFISVVIYSIKKKLKNEIVLGFLIYIALIFPVSNILFMIGTPMAERLTFLPKLGLVILFYFLIIRVFKIKPESIKNKSLLTPFVILIVFIFSGRSYARVNDWKDDFSIISSSVENSSVRNKMTYMLLLNNENEDIISLKTKEIEYKKYAPLVIKSFKNIPEEKIDNHILGLAHYYNNNPEEAIKYLSKIKNANFKSKLILAESYLKLNNVDNSLDVYKEILELKNFNRAVVYNNVGLLYFRLKEYQKSIDYLIKAYNENSEFDKIELKIALSYAGALDYNNSIKYYELGLPKNPTNKQAVNNYYHISIHLKREKEMYEFLNKLLNDNPNNQLIKDILKNKQ